MKTYRVLRIRSSRRGVYFVLFSISHLGMVTGDRREFQGRGFMSKDIVLWPMNNVFGQDLWWIAGFYFFSS